MDILPAGAEGSIKFSVMPAGMKFSFFHELLHPFFFQNDQKNELDSDLYVKICGYHFYTNIWLIIQFSTENIKHSYLRW